MVLAYKFVHNLERFELVVRVVLLLLVVVVVITADSIATILFVLKFDTTFIFIGFRLEDIVPPGNLVERLVKLVLLVLTIDTVLFRNLVLVSHLHAQDTGKQVGSVADLGCCCRLHICWIFKCQNFCDLIR